MSDLSFERMSSIYMLTQDSDLPQIKAMMQMQGILLDMFSDLKGAAFPKEQAEKWNMQMDRWKTMASALDTLSKQQSDNLILKEQIKMLEKENAVLRLRLKQEV